MCALRLVRRLVGCALFVLPLAPLPWFFGEIRGLEWTFGPVDWVLGVGIVLGAAAVAQILVPERLLARFDTRSPAWVRGFRSADGNGGLAVAAVLALMGILVFLSRYGFQGRPHLIDDLVQLFQAEIFAAGRLRAPPPPLAEFFVTQHMLLDPDAWYSQYPPGHSAVLALGVFLGAAWAVPIVLSVASALWMFSFTRRIYGRRTALVCLGLTIVSPFFLFLGASFMNHVSGLASASAATWALGRALTRSPTQQERSVATTPQRAAIPQIGWLTACFAALAAGFLSRPLTAGAIAIAFGCIVLQAAPTRRGFLALAIAGTAFSSIAAWLFVYNAMTTGDPLLAGYEKLWGPAHGLGFHMSPWGDEHTPWAGLRNELTDVSLLNEALLDWPVPALWPVALWLVFAPRLRPWDRRLLVAFFSVPAAYFFYWHRDSFLGPRFLYETLPFVLPLTARALTGGLDLLRGRVWIPGRGIRPIHLARLARTAVALSALYAILWALPARAVVTSRWLPSMKLDVAGQARAAGIHDAIVFVATSWGGRVIAELRGLGVPASIVERAYHVIDHCELDGLLRRAHAEVAADESRGADRVRAREAAGRRLATAIEARLATDDGSVGVDWTADRTLRLRPDPALLTPDCVAEMAYDAAGFTLYEPTLPDNAPTLDGDVIFARDLRERDPELCALYPGRTAWLYRGGRFVELADCRPDPA